MSLKGKPNTYKGLIKNFAKASGYSVQKVDKLFQKLGDVVEKQYKKKPTDPDFYRILVGILKKMLKLKNYKRPSQKEARELVNNLLIEVCSYRRFGCYK